MSRTLAQSLGDGTYIGLLGLSGLVTGVVASSLAKVGPTSIAITAVLTTATGCFIGARNLN